MELISLVQEVVRMPDRFDKHVIDSKITQSHAKYNTYFSTGKKC